jgi:hypothetical protein
VCGGEIYMKKLIVILLTFTLLFCSNTVVFAGYSPEFATQKNNHDQYYDMYSQKSDIVKYNILTSSAVDVVVGLNYTDNEMSIEDAVITLVLDLYKSGEDVAAIEILCAPTLKEAIALTEKSIKLRLVNEMNAECSKRRDGWYYKNLEENLNNNYTSLTANEIVLQFIQLSIVSPIGS